MSRLAEHVLWKISLLLFYSKLEKVLVASVILFLQFVVVFRLDLKRFYFELILIRAVLKPYLFRYTNE